MDGETGKSSVNVLYGTRFLSLYDYEYKEGRHYYVASRRKKDDLVLGKSDEDAQSMLPDAVTVAVVLHLPDGEERLLLFYEYRYPAGRFLLSPVAGLIDPEDEKTPEPLVSAAVREIKEEAGLTVKETDTVRTVIPVSYCTPGMTDETNAFLRADVAVSDLSGLDHGGAVGSELFREFVLLDRTEAEKIYREARDEYGNWFSLATWTVLGIFLSGK
ncbi:MAG: NUDIX hydrolase [Lachnospiraceae bacterium]|nr:NUDIX hydrolase [Lachnospiraceae bacterium]